MRGGPIIAYSDAECVYDKDVADQLVTFAAGLDLSPQPAVLGAFDFDASYSEATGISPKAAVDAQLDRSLGFTAYLLIRA